MTTTFRVVNGDVSFGAGSGQPEMISDRVKLNQDVRELILIDTQSDTGFGANLDRMIGKMPSDELSPASINWSFSSQVQNAIERFMVLQRRYLFGQRPQTELLAKIDYMQAAPDRVNPTLWRFLVILRTLAGQNLRAGGTLAQNSGR